MTVRSRAARIAAVTGALGVGLLGPASIVGTAAPAAAAESPSPALEIGTAVAVTPPPPLPVDASAFVPVAPTRLVDTRIVGPRPTAGSTLRVPVAGKAGIEPGATAAVLTVTVTGAATGGFVTVFPSGGQRPLASAVNYVAGQTIANLVTAPLGADGAVEVFTSGVTHLVVDVSGQYRRTVEAVAGGRFVLAGPTRAFDSRIGHAPLGVAETRVIDLATAGVPADAAGVALTVTVTAAAGPGFWTVWSADAVRPGTSSLNVERAGQTIAAQVVVGATNGRVQVFAQTGGDVVVDVAAYLTGPSSPSGTDGLFVPVPPVRVEDTRDGYRRIGLAGAAEVPIVQPLAAVLTAAFAGAPPAVAGVVGNLTLVDAAAAGYATAFAAGNAAPLASNVNGERAGQTIADHVIVPGSERGLGIYLQSGGDVVVDVTGVLLGPPRPSPLPSPATTRIETAVRLAEAEIGKPYVLGSAGPDTFDCSGLVAFVFNRAGVRHSRLLADQYAHDPRWRHVPLAEARRGDLVFWRGLHTGVADHMGIYLGDGLVLQADAPPWKVASLPYFHWETTTWSGQIGVMYEEVAPWAVRMVEGPADVATGLVDDPAGVNPMARGGWTPTRPDNHPTVAPGRWTAATLQLGDRSDSVRLAEDALVARGRNPGPQDGIFDITMAAVVADYQLTMGLPVSGVVDAITRGSLGISPGPDGG